ncbi:zf-HC2 domain-containing protein [Lysinibacillus piscis]|uniref:Putative zinc-finger domain-containing protein n=1 Tax=Lysinibacillus piscis TaxID=2518931 RepID=A0ABQ5NMA4_9BACI|nr:zf-HC2 domain-containing protein [Lysinibacillus sp. KH24]GLC89486.1 hypothetical protein LYSBPC_26130 [Lysinibacillus sp. KH24]
MKNECDIIKDLLPSYIDHLCSEATSAFVEEHIATCKQCAQLVEHMCVEFDMKEQAEKLVGIEQKKPFQKVAYFLKAQKNYTQLLRTLFWISLTITIALSGYSLRIVNELYHEREEAQMLEQEKLTIMEDAFAVLLERKEINESAFQEVFQKYSQHIQHLAVFSVDDSQKFTRLDGGVAYPYSIDYVALQKEPKNMYPINYTQAVFVAGSKGTITASDYDIGTVAMANKQWIVQFEYKESYFERVESAFQTKHYGPSYWTILQLPIVFIMMTVFILGIWLFQKRMMQPVKNMVS